MLWMKNVCVIRRRSSHCCYSCYFLPPTIRTCWAQHLISYRRCRILFFSVFLTHTLDCTMCTYLCARSSQCHNTRLITWMHLWQRERKKTGSSSRRQTDRQTDRQTEWMSLRNDARLLVLRRSDVAWEAPLAFLVNSMWPRGCWEECALIRSHPESHLETVIL